jgi:hypothetical protein
MDDERTPGSLAKWLVYHKRASICATAEAQSGRRKEMLYA